MDNKGKPSHEVGYRRPPKKTQFKPGQSGNPNGRPKGEKNMETIIRRELDRRAPITENGKHKQVSKREIAIRQQVNKAAAGDLKSAGFVLGLDAAASEKKAETSQVFSREADLQTFEELRERIRRRNDSISAEGSTSPPDESGTPQATAESETKSKG